MSAEAALFAGQFQHAFDGEAAKVQQVVVLREPSPTGRLLSRSV